MQTFLSENENQTEQFARSEIAPTLQGGDVVALYGELGMGKTAFVRGLAQGLGVSDPVSSPTFALVHLYRGNPPLAHFDMYRVTGWDDLEQSGYFDYIENGAVVAVEWSENVENALPPTAVRVRLAPGETENQRKITIEGGGRF